MKPLLVTVNYKSMQSKIEQQVMASVGAIYATRVLASATALKIYVLAGSAWALGALVWVARVQENLSVAFHGGVGPTFGYLLSAVTSTELAVQTVLVVAVFALGSLAVDAARSLGTPRHTFA